MPSFNLESQMGRISFKDIIDGKWALLVTFGSAFDPVTTTDMGMLAKLYDEFEARNIFVCFVGNDTVANYRHWVRDIEELQSVKFNYALLSDSDCSVLKALGCARENALTKKIKPTSFGAFLVDIDKRLRFSMHTSPLVGRNWYEVLRQFDALNMVTMHKVVAPSNWCQGQEVMLKRDVTPEEAAEYRYVEIKEWFKVTSCPETN